MKISEVCIKVLKLAEIFVGLTGLLKLITFCMSLVHLTRFRCTLLLNVVHPPSTFNIATNYRVIWCQYVPSYGEDSDTLDDPAKLLALLNGNKGNFKCYHQVDYHV